jgi:hypothetical protein
MSPGIRKSRILLEDWRTKDNMGDWDRTLEPDKNCFGNIKIRTLRSSSTNHTHQLFSTFLTAPPERSSSYSFRKSRETSSSAELSLLSLDAEKNSNPEFKHTFCQ